MTSRRLQQRTNSTAEGGLVLVLGGLAQIGEASNCPGLKGFAGIAGVIVDICNSAKANKEECKNISHDIGTLAMAILNEVEENMGQLSEEFVKHISTMCKKLTDLQSSLQDLTSGRLSRIMGHSQDRFAIQRIQRDLKQIFDVFTLQSASTIQRDAQRIEKTGLRRQDEIREKIKEVSQLALAEVKKAAKEVKATPSSQGPVLPLYPRRFFGRAQEEDAVVETLTAHGSGRVAILGPGGIGKTSLAAQVLYDHRIITKFGDRRFFVACDAASSKDDLLSAIANALKIQGDKLQKMVLDRFQLADGPSLLCLDNFESPWEPTASKAEVEMLLSMFSSIPSLSLIVTMRGAERPAKVAWTRPFLPQLKPLSLDAARDTFLALSDCSEDDPNVDLLIAAVDNVPLPVTLMAALAQVEKTEVLLRRWEEEQSSLLHRTCNRRDSLDVSIQVSLSSPRMQAVPEAMELLRLLSILPDGIDSRQLDAIFPHLVNSRKALSTLWQTSLAFHDSTTYRSRVLSPIRSYMNSHSPPNATHLGAMMTYYMGLCRMSSDVGGLNGRTIMKRLSPEVGNLHSIVNLALSPEHQSSFLASALGAAIDLTRFWRYTRLGNTETLRRAAAIVDKSESEALRADVYFNLSWASWMERLKETESICLKALGIYEQISNLSGQADCYWLQGQILKNTPRQKGCQALYEKGIELSIQSGNRYCQGKCLSTLSEITFYKGDVEGSERFSQEALAIFRELGTCVAATNIGVSLYWLGYLASSQSKTTLALTYYTEAVKILEQTGACLWVGHVLIRQGDLFQARCDFLSARDCYQHAAVVFADQGALYSSLAGYTHTGLAEVAAALHEWEKAQEYADIAWRVFEGSSKTHGIFTTQILQAHIRLHHHRDVVEAERLYMLALSSCRAAGFTEEEATCYVHLGLLHAASGRFADAIRCYVTSLAVYMKLANSMRKAGVLVKIADLYRSSGEAEVAFPVYQAVYPLSYQLEAYRDAADALLNMGRIKRSRPLLESARDLYEKSADITGQTNCTSILEEMKDS